MIAGVIQQAMGGVLVRARMEARKAAFAGIAAMLVVGALTLSGAAGIVVMSSRYGVVAGLLSGSGLLLVFALIAFLVGRRVPGADASRRAVAAEALVDDVPAPGVPLSDPIAAEPGRAATFARVHREVRGHLDGILPPGSEGAITQVAAHHLARRPVPTLAFAVAAGAVIGLVRARSARIVTEEPTPAPGDHGSASGSGPNSDVQTPAPARAGLRRAARRATAVRSAGNNAAPRGSSLRR